jgi:hypothetical protein
MGRNFHQQTSLIRQHPLLNGRYNVAEGGSWLIWLIQIQVHAPLNGYMGGAKLGKEIVQGCQTFARERATVITQHTYLPKCRTSGQDTPQQAHEPALIGFGDVCDNFGELDDDQSVGKWSVFPTLLLTQSDFRHF